MAQTTTWKITDMNHDTDTGGVTLVCWECVVQDDENPDCVAIKSSELVTEYDVDSPDFVALNALSDADVLNWVWAKVDKDAIEADRQERVANQVAQKTSQSTGLPWAAE